MRGRGIGGRLDRAKSDMPNENNEIVRCRNICLQPISD